MYPFWGDIWFSICPTVRWSQMFDFATSPAFKREFLKTFRACLLSMKNRISLLQLDRTISEGVIAHFHFEYFIKKFVLATPRTF